MYLNVYRPDGTALFLMAAPSQLATKLREAWYVHGLAKPDYDVLQTKEAALEASRARHAGEHKRRRPVPAC